MGLTSKKTIQELLIQKGIRPSKEMGQCFLINQHILEKIIETANINNQDTILEVGPGLGTLTQELAKRAKKVIAIEKDPKMVHILKETLRDYQNIEIIQENALTYDYSPFATNYKLVANIPYYLTSPLIRKFLEAEYAPRAMVLMIQKEVAQRICSKPPHMSLLAVSVQFYAEPKIITYVSKECFWPAPKIDSAVIQIIPSKKAYRGLTPVSFFRVVKAGFSQPRKQLANNLSKKLTLSREEIHQLLRENNIQPNQRAETLTINDWTLLTKALGTVN